MLEPVRESFRSGKSLVWNRVNDLPDFVYFNHSIHINKGVGCNTCHGPRYITMQPPLPAATWEAEVEKMNKTFGAAIPEDNTKRITLYLEAHYTTDNRKQ